VTLTSTDYDAAYFASVYGSASETGEPEQTWIDKARDRLLVRSAAAASAKSLAECSVVDVGCGYGWLLDTFAGARALCGSDISEHAVQMARTRHPDRDFRQADLQAGAPFEGPFDIVLAVNLIEHLPDPQAGVESIARLCTRGSIVVVHLPVVENRLSNWIYQRTYASDPTHIYRPSGRTIREMFEGLGFATARESYFPHRLPRITRHLRIHPSYLAIFAKG